MSLTLFENITEQLTELERKTLVPMLIDTLETKTAENKVKGKHLCAWIKACRYNTSEARIRKMINYIRVMNLMQPKSVIGTSNGYFVTDDPEIVEDQIESLQGRVDSQLAVIDSMKAQRDNLKCRKGVRQF